MQARTCSRCPSKASKGRSTCTPCHERLNVYRARYKAKANGFAGPMQMRFMTEGVTLRQWQEAMRKLAANLGVR